MNQVSLDDTDVPGGHIDIDFEPSQVTVLQLKRWLAVHGLKQGGNKPELILRVKNAMRMGVAVFPGMK